jgi:hypothetical protein
VIEKNSLPAQSRQVDKRMQEPAKRRETPRNAVIFFAPGQNIFCNKAKKNPP